MLSRIFGPPTPDALVRRLDSLPLSPRVLPVLQQRLTDPNVDLVEVTSLIELEPGLTGRVVQMANSPYFSRNRQVDGIEEAVQRVGFNGIYRLVAYAVANDVVGHPLQAYGLEGNVLWKRAVACGLAAEILADHVGLESPVAYTAGLLHASGLVAINAYALRQKPVAWMHLRGYPDDASEDERSTLGYTHAEAGAALLSLWGFKSEITVAVCDQLAPEITLPTRRVGVALAVARWARSLLCGTESENIPELPPGEWLEALDMSVDHFDDWLRILRRRFVNACEELRIAS